MRKINKITNIALIFMLIGAILWQDISYANDISHLRVPIEGHERLEKSQLASNEAVEDTEEDDALAGIVSRELVQIIRELDEEKNALFIELTHAFEETLTPLREKTTDVTVRRLRALFSLKQKEIYDILRKIRENRNARYFYANRKERWVRAVVNANPSYGLCVDINASFKKAIEDIGLTESLEPREEPVEIGEDKGHFYISILGKNRDRIAIDLAFGQLVRPDFRRAMIYSLDRYRHKVDRQARKYRLGTRSRLYVNKARHMEREFEILHRNMFLEKLAAALLNSKGL